MTTVNPVTCEDLGSTAPREDQSSITEVIATSGLAHLVQWVTRRASADDVATSMVVVGPLLLR